MMGSRLVYQLGIYVMAVLSPGLLCQEPRVTGSRADTTQTAPANGVLLEIFREGRGMLPYRGRWLYFRLYQNGRAEYEKLATSQDDHQMRPIKQEMQLSTQQRQRIIELINARDFLNAEEHYKELWHGVDTVFITKISSNTVGSNKQITLVNFDIEARGYYPEAVVTLMRVIEELLKTNR
jgi:hypothetical protein